MDTKTLCLGTLTLKDASGYEIKKFFAEAFSHFQGVSYGSIYPALARLTEEGMVTFHEAHEEGRPAKKVFRLTEAGHARLLDVLLTTPPTERCRSDFLVLMMFAHLLPTERVAEILDQHCAGLVQEIQTLEAILAAEQDCPEFTPGMRFTVGYGIASKRARLDFIEQNRGDLLRAHARGLTAGPATNQGIEA